MKSENEMINLRNSYISSCYKKQELICIIEYCKYLGFDNYKTRMMVALTTGQAPLPGESFADLRSVPDAEREMIAEIVGQLKDNENG